MNRVFFRAEAVPPPPWIPAARAFVQKVLDCLGRKNWELSVLFCGNPYIRTLNARYRAKDEATDVLSFSLGEKSPGGRYLAGDIVISLDALEENVRFFRVSRDDELRRLLAHGVLHLCGEDHATNNAGEPMLKKQEQILAALAGEHIIDSSEASISEQLS